MCPSVLKLIAFGQLLLLSPFLLGATAPVVDTETRVKLRMVLVLKDLTLRPVPRHAIRIIPASSGQSTQPEPLSITTGFDGTADATLSAGVYQLVVLEPVEIENHQYTWDLSISIPPSRGEISIDLSNDNATVKLLQSTTTSVTVEGRIFTESRNGVVTVESELGHGSGFLIDSAGMLLTNAHVVEGSRELAVDFDSNHRFVAEKLAVDSENDIAVLRYNPLAYPQAQPLKLAFPPEDSPIQEGDLVIAIGSPLNQEKILTRGIVSKVQDHIIISDVNINHGNSGGPLLDAKGVVVGITTFKDVDPAGGGVSGIVRIGVAKELIGKARTEASEKIPPDAAPLPSMPEEHFPLIELKKQIQERQFNPKDYGLRSTTFDVQVITPPLKYYLETKESAEAADIRAKKLRKAAPSSDNPDADPYSNLKAWRVALGDYRPVVEIYMLPRLKATGGSIFSAIMTGVSSVLRYRYKSDFDKADLIIDGETVTPIRRSRVSQAAKFMSNAGSADDVSYAGVYTFGPEFLKEIHPGSKVLLVIHDGLKPEKPISIQVDPTLLLKVHNDMVPVTGLPPLPPQQQIHPDPSF